MKIMIDVGAHKGGSCIPAAKRGWRVYAFEPHKGNRNGLYYNLAYENCLENVDVVPKGLSNKTGKATLFESTSSSGMHSLHGDGVGQEIEITTLAEFVKEQGIPHIDYLKVDVEGHDLQVLEGADLSNLKPNVIKVEFGPENIQLLWDLLLGAGYTIQVAVHKPKAPGARAKFSHWSTDPTNLQPGEWGDLVAVLDKDIFKNL